MAAATDALAKRVMRLHSISRDTAGDGVCLGGEPPAFYYSQALPEFNDSWLIELEGGGWCVDPSACLFRAISQQRQHQASTKSLSGFATHTPEHADFHGFHRVWLKYCDGGSWTGGRAAPLEVGGKKVWLRGRAVLATQLAALLRLGLGSARQVLLAGSSAGGLAALIHADWIRTQLGGQLQKFKVLVGGGFFSQSLGGCHNLQDCPWLRSMRATVELHNSSASFAPACSEMLGWRCIFANESAVFARTPAFLLTSGVDLFQLTNIWRADYPCFGSSFRKCSPVWTLPLHLRACSQRDLPSILYTFTRGCPTLPPAAGPHRELEALLHTFPRGGSLGVDEGRERTVRAFVCRAWSVHEKPTIQWHQDRQREHALGCSRLVARTCRRSGSRPCTHASWCVARHDPARRTLTQRQPDVRLVRTRLEVYGSDGHASLLPSRRGASSLADTRARAAMLLEVRVRAASRSVAYT